MIPESVLLAAATVLAGLLAVAWLVFLGHGLIVGARRRRMERLREMRGVLMRGVSRLDLPAEQRARLRRLSLRDRVRLVSALAPNLRGAERDWLGGVAAELGIVDAAVRLCRSRFWWRRLYGARLLTLVGGGGDAVLGLSGDPNPLVRAQAAEWAGVNATPEGVHTLVSMLGDPARACRFTVEDALLRLGADAVDPLAGHLREAVDPLELQGGLHVAKAIGDPRFLPGTLAATDAGDPAVRAAACRALGSLGGSDAAARLVSALADPAPRVRAIAAASLGEIGHWPAASALAALLRDPEWDVRTAAAAALVRLGPPGELMLRGARRSEDAFAADMARHALEASAVTAGKRLPG